jgi:D-serine deaminase-like pyridoxal phosphate-dependent protein
LSLDSLDTPALLIEGERLDRNIDEMAEACRTHGKALRPHIKTHKMIEIAARQRAQGAVGLTVAKLAEAEVFAAAGFDDLLICYPIVGEQKRRRLVALAKRIRISTIADDVGTVAALAAAATEAGVMIDVLIKLDVGMHRVGVDPAGAEALAHEVAKLEGLRLRGVCIHEGIVYSEPEPARRRALARQHVFALVATAERLRRQGLTIDIVSSGATPAVRDVLDIDGLTEVRPGNYVFYDRIQTELGVVLEDCCALTVLSTVVSHSDPARAIIDAGAKALTLDRGAHGRETVRGYGRISQRDDISIVSLSEEHGWLELSEGSHVRIGDRLRIVPNHSCAVVNNFDVAILLRGGSPTERWLVAARGRMT